MARQQSMASALTEEGVAADTIETDTQAALAQHSGASEHNILSTPNTRMQDCASIAVQIAMFPKPIESQELVQNRRQSCKEARERAGNAAASSVLECAVCGDRDGNLFLNETWAGSFQSACNHASCEGCLREWIQQDLPRCRQEQQLRVKCAAPGCRKFIPQTLVFQCSSAAKGLALEIDRANNQVSPVYNSLSMNWQSDSCMVCNDYIGPTLQCPACGHSACEDCTGRWVDMQVPRCASKLLFGFRCFNPDCMEAMAEPVVLLNSRSAVTLKRDLRRRARLQANRLYPPEVQVNCPQAGCVGLGYLGFDTAMCFICEHQWSLVQGDAPPDGLPRCLKPCPSCGALIEKNGGCDHMTCRCKHEFYWSTLMSFKAS